MPDRLRSRSAIFAEVEEHQTQLVVSLPPFLHRAAAITVWDEEFHSVGDQELAFDGNASAAHRHVADDAIDGAASIADDELAAFQGPVSFMLPPVGGPTGQRRRSGGWLVRRRRPLSSFLALPNALPRTAREPACRWGGPRSLLVADAGLAATWMPPPGSSAALRSTPQSLLISILPR